MLTDIDTIAKLVKEELTNLDIEKATLKELRIAITSKHGVNLTGQNALIRDLVAAEMQARAIITADGGGDGAAGPGDDSPAAHADRAGAPPVDNAFEYAKLYTLHQFSSEAACPEGMSPVASSSPWSKASVMLMKTDLRAGPRGSNKYYLLQLLRRADVPPPADASSGEEQGVGSEPHPSGAAPWCMHVRHGRVGYAGHQPGPYMFTDFSSALAKFCKTFDSKTGQGWGEGAGPEDCPGKYRVVDLAAVEGEGIPSQEPGTDVGNTTGAGSDWDALDDAAIAEVFSSPGAGAQRGAAPARAGAKRGRAAARAKVVASALPVDVQRLMALLCDRDALDSALDALSLDRKRMPLGRLAKKQLMKGYRALADIETALGKRAGEKKLADLSADFYVAVPHAFGMSKPPTLRSAEAVAARKEALDTLAQMDVAAKILRARATTLHRFDYAAAVLGAVFSPVANDGLLWNALQSALTGTHAPTHTGFQLKLRGAWGAATRGSAASWAPWENAAWDFEESGSPASKLLWHGSRQTNWLSILAQGLRIAPSEAPITGDMFGRGVYLADCASKAANYCHPSRDSPVGLLALVQTWTGAPHKLARAVNGLRGPPEPYHSVLGMGRTVPEPSSWQTLPGLPSGASDSLASAHIAMGPLVPAAETGNKALLVDVEGDGVDTGDLLYNEYVVHDASQAVIRWVVEVQFVYDADPLEAAPAGAGQASASSACSGEEEADDDDVGL